MRIHTFNVNSNNWFFPVIVFCGLVFLISVVLLGISVVFTLIYPILLLLTAISCLFLGVLAFRTFVLGQTPLTWFLTAQALTGACGVTTWIYALAVIIQYFGFSAVFFLILFPLILPGAAAVLMVNSRWIELGVFLTALVVSFLLKLIKWPHSPTAQRTSSPEDVIDIEAHVEDPES